MQTFLLDATHLHDLSWQQAIQRERQVSRVGIRRFCRGRGEHPLFLHPKGGSFVPASIATWTRPRHTKPTTDKNKPTRFGREVHALRFFGNGLVIFARVDRRSPSISSFCCCCSSSLAMPGVAFDGSAWVTGAQVVSLALGSIASLALGIYASRNTWLRMEEEQGGMQDRWIHGTHENGRSKRRTRWKLSPRSTKRVESNGIEDEGDEEASN